MILILAEAGCLGGGKQAPEELWIFIMAGQSNMVGMGDPADLPAGFSQADENIWLFGNDDVWKPALEPLDDATGQVDSVSADYFSGVGPGLAFARQLRILRPELRIGLVPCALSGSAMAQWMAQGGSETLYGSCVRRATAAAGRGRVAGLLWYQGESDTRTAAMVGRWPGQFKLLVRRFRDDLSIADLPVVFVQIGDLGPRFKNERFRDLWREMQKNQAATAIAHGAVVSAMGLPLMPDGVHLSTAAELELGRKMALAMDGLLPHVKH